MPAVCQWTDCEVAVIKPARGRMPKWCPGHKAEAYRLNKSSDSQTTFCTEPNCGRPRRAKGMCSMHYKRGRPITMITILCDGCGTPCQKEPSRLNKYATLYCTPRCKTEHQWREVWASRKAVSIYDPAFARANKNGPKRKDVSVEPQRIFKCGNCATCGQAFVTVRLTITCSDACATNWQSDKRREYKHARRARKRSAYRSPVVRSAIYLRDDYTCQLCMKPMDMDATVPHPYAPTIDHAIPLARGGTHEPSNVQAAHFICNSTKSDRMPSEMVGMMAVA